LGAGEWQGAGLGTRREVFDRASRGSKTGSISSAAEGFRLGISSLELQEPRLPAAASFPPAVTSCQAIPTFTGDWPRRSHAIE
jgi:hypothetical protein